MRISLFITNTKQEKHLKAIQAVDINITSKVKDGLYCVAFQP
jgi:hypothetical protein